MHTQGRIQFFIDALDGISGQAETEVVINHFPIDLELQLGPNFNARANYTGFYNISGVEFDMNFRVQCSARYDSSTNCTGCLPYYSLVGTQCTLTGKHNN